MTTSSVRFAVLLAVALTVLPKDSKSQWAIEDDGCRTPNRGVGTCVVIQQCKPMLDFLAQASTPLPQHVVHTLRRYQCGYEGSSVKVCCPDGPIHIGGGKPNVGNKDPVPPDVSRHRNIKLLPDECGPLPNRDKIVGGNKTALFEFPWMALLGYQTAKGFEFKCGGSIINNRYILTAAHCVTNLEANLRLISVRVGEYNISSSVDCQILDGEEVCAPPVQNMDIEQIIPHPSYNSSIFTDDIGLIRLAGKMDLSPESVKAICLPITSETRNSNFTNQNLIVTGWGATETGYKSEDLLKVEIPVLGINTCKQIYEKQTPAKLSHKQLCVGGRNRKDSCPGDSGGPLQTVSSFKDNAAFVQYGIVSFGPRLCGREGFPAIYTNVAFYMDWILDNMRP